jgi:hypothetical protein
MKTLTRILGSKILPALIVIAWAASIGLLIERHYLPASGGPAGQRAPVIKPQLGEQWMGVYMQGRKIGWSHSLMRERDGGGYYLDDLTWMRMAVMGTPKEISTRVRATLTPEMRIEDVRAEISSDVSLEIAARVEGTEMALTISTAGQSQSMRMPLPETPTMDSAMVEMLRAEGFRAGQQMSSRVFNPSTLSVEEFSAAVKGRSPVSAMGAEREAWEVIVGGGGMEMTVWVEDDGTVLRVDMPMGMSLVRETAEQARMGIEAPPDVITALSVPVSPALPDEAAFVRLRISGVDTSGMDLDGGRQSFADGVLTITREDLAAPVMPGEPEDVGDTLGPTMLIQSGDASIMAKAAEITRGADTDEERAQRIYEWVYATLMKTSVVSIPSAVQVLGELKGDCNEHTVLYTALARAAGVPARMCVGLAHQRGAFYYHAWPEVYLRGRWVAVDPTFGQWPADAGHIRMAIGDLSRQQAVVPAMGRIAISVIESR